MRCLERLSNRSIDLPLGIIQSSVYFLKNNDDRIIAHLSLRHSIETEFLSTIGGHIGYGVRPIERKKGYATKMLSLALNICRKINLDKVMISCKKENIASSKIIEKNGGVFEKEVCYENSTFLVYWINCIRF